MSDPSRALTIDAGLLARYREAGRAIAWRPAVSRSAARRARIAHLHDEEARVEEWGTRARAGIAADSGPVGALVVLLEIDRRGSPTKLGARNAGRDAAFPAGSIVAVWGSLAIESDSEPRLEDLVQLARYALA